MNVSILVHGGAGNFTSLEDATETQAGCLNAARAGHAMLAKGRSAIDAVVAAVVMLENDPHFNAGTGSALNRDGAVEMDAALMDGCGGRAGAVAAVRTVKNPILLARLVMERTTHVFLVGEGAEAFAREQGVTSIEPASLVTPEARLRWQKARGSQYGTVGAVAFDGAHVAAATSTGGTAGKLPGRVGDSPLIGCGTYAFDGAGAVSCTGLGEAIIRALLGKSAVDLLVRDVHPTAAARQIIPQLVQFGGEGGLILVDAHGRLGLAFNTDRMAHAWVDGKGDEGVGFSATPRAESS